MKYLALGDSYTIGEQVEYAFNFPNQLCQILKLKYPSARLDLLIAVTGWSTDELSTAIEKAKPCFDYDLVTLLIGVNNQYRGRSVTEYRWQFYSLLCQSILFASANPKNVVVLSIPDWGLTPFNKLLDKETVSKEIDEFNTVNQEISVQMGCHYIDITTSSRFHAHDLHFLAKDQLHYSEKEYEIWAHKIADLIL